MTIVHVQPALPSYRIDFFQRLASHYGNEMRVYYSPVDMGAITGVRERAPWEHPIGTMRRLVFGLEWQVGALNVQVQASDTLVVCGAPRNLSTLLLLLRARMIGARTIWWGQYWSAATEPHRHALRMRLARLADSLLFYTDEEVDRYHSEGWTHPGHVGALNNGTDLTAVRLLRHSYDATTRGRNLLFIGRLTEKAQLHLAIEALADPGLDMVHLHVIGDGTQAVTLRRLAADLGVGHRIIWHGGTTDEGYIAKVANRCAAFVYPGSVGLSLIHAMGYGLPCIVHDQPLRHMPEIAAFEDGLTGAAFSEGDTAALVRAVLRLLDDRTSLETMSSACLDTTAKRFNTEHMAERFIEFVDDNTI